MRSNGLLDLEYVSFGTFTKICSSLHPPVGVSLHDMYRRLKNTFSLPSVPKVTDEKIQVKVKAYFYDRVQEYHVLQKEVTGNQKNISNPWVHAVNAGQKQAAASHGMPPSKARASVLTVLSEAATISVLSDVTNRPR